MASDTPPQPTAGGVPKDQLPGHASFRRQRASRACETCHSRKVRCDAASLGVPCTNCVAFSIECKIPTPKRKKTQQQKKDGAESENSYGGDQQSPGVSSDVFPSRDAVISASHRNSIGMNAPEGMPATEATEAYQAQAKINNSTYTQYMKPKFARAPIKEAGRVAYLGESSNLSLLVQDRHGTTDVVHYPLPDNIRGARQKADTLDNVELDILHQRGAFLLPPRALCDELVDAYFQWIAPVVPVINRSRFMRRYRDSKNPPSLLLLQAILLAGSRVCSNPQLMDANGSTTPAAMTFYKRAKALYDANYEDDRVTIVQALILMGWYWEGPEDVTKNVFYWSRVAVIVAQGSGMHRSVEQSQLNKADKRMWKRIWWTLFTRDRSVAVALGRPCCINIEDSDVEMVCEDDFIDDDGDRTAEYPPDPIHVQFFLNYVKLCEIMGLVLSQQYSVASKLRRNNAIDLTHSDMALADWLQNCPPEVKWEAQRHHFWSALLHSNYYTTLCLLHRAHMPPAGSPASRPPSVYPEETAYPSKTIAYQAAGMITSIVEALQKHDQIRYTPAFIVYSLFSALIMHVYQMRSSNQVIVSATQHRLTICMNALRDVSKVWLVAKMVHTLFESILGNKVLEERLQKAAGRKHVKVKQNGNGMRTQSDSRTTPSMQNSELPAFQPGETTKRRKLDDYDFGIPNGPPSAQMSYERSRPQSPVNTPGKEAPLPPMNGQGQTQTQPQTGPSLSATSPTLRQNTDAFMGPSRINTRPTTPFNGLSYPGTPPDFFLHTRNSPQISQDLWQNYQPDQLFPPETNILFPMQSPNQVMVDPALRGPSQPQAPSQQSLFQPPPQHSQNTQQIPTASSTPQQSQQFSPTNAPTATTLPLGYQQEPQPWQQQYQPAMSGTSNGGLPDDQWSNGSSGPIVPTTLNVGDWFEFFGIPNTGQNIDALSGDGGYG